MNIPTFEDIEISTKTIIGVSNLEIDIDKLYDLLPVSPYTVVPKRRGRRKKSAVPDVNEHLPPGSIITLKYQDKLRGIDLKDKKKKPKGAKKYFRNALTVVMKITEKIINFKISKNGKFQITGSKTDEQAEECIKHLWEKIKDHEHVASPPFRIKNDEGEVSIIFINVMTNIDFNLGFLVNRENLDKNINQHTPYNSLLETSFGYTGVNIKFPLTRRMDIPLKQITNHGGEWVESYTPHSAYIDSLPLKEKEKEMSKKRYITFLVFHSGNVIMSGMTQEFMRDVYYEFFDIVQKCREDIVEKLL